MLICQINALHIVHFLNLTDQIALNSLDILDLQQIVRIDGTFGKLIAGLNGLSVGNLYTCTVRYLVGLFSLIILDDDLSLIAGIYYADLAADTCDESKSLRLSGLEKLLYTGKTLCNIVTCDTTGMECTHGKLCTGLTD